MRDHSSPSLRGESLEYMVHGSRIDKDAWERAHQTTPEFKALFGQLPLTNHSLSRGSFFEAAYEFSGYV